MPPPLEIPNLDHLIERHRAGEPMNKLAAEVGTSGSVLKHHFSLRGVTTRSLRESVLLAHGLSIPTLPEIIARYQSGESAVALAVAAGVSDTGLRGVLKRAGVRLRTYRESLPFVKRSGRPKRVDGLPGLAARYVAGESLLSLSKQSGHSRTVLAKRLAQEGVQVRDQSEAERLKWAAMTDSTRTKQTRAAHIAWKGLFEDDVAEMLRSRGLAVTQQKTVGRYDLDIALEELPIAIEVTSYSPAQFRACRGRQRLKYLLNRNWLVIYLRRHPARSERRSPSGSAFSIGYVADQMMPLLDRASSDPAVFGKYRVILCHPEYRPSSSYNLDGLPAVA